MADSFWQKALRDPYIMQVPSQRPEVLPAPGAGVGKPAPAAPLREAVVGKLRKQYPDLEDLGDDELLKGVHGVLTQDKVLPPESTVEEMMKHLGASGIVTKIGQPGKVSNQQMNVPMLNPSEVPSERVWPDLVKANWPDLADLPAKDVLRGVFREQRKSGKIAKGSTFEQFLTGLVGSGEATAKGVPGKTIRGLISGTVEPLFGAPIEAAGNLLAAGAMEGPEYDAMRARGVAAAGRAAGAFATIPLAAAETLVGAAGQKLGAAAPAWLKAITGTPAGGKLVGTPRIQTARQLIGQQIASNAKALGIFNALTTAGEVIPEMAAGDETVGRALTRIGISTAIGAVTGAVAGPTLGALGHGERITMNNAAAKLIAANEVKQLQSKAIQVFVNDFKPEWIGQRFRDDFNPALPDEQIARTIVSKIGNSDPAAAPKDMVDAVAQKVGEYRLLQEKQVAGLGARVFPELGAVPESVAPPTGVEPLPGLEVAPAPAPPTGVSQITQPIGAPLEGVGGAAPEPNMLPGGPLGEQAAPFVPPTGVKAMPGIEAPSASAAQAAPEPIVPERVPQATPGAVEPVRGLVQPAEGIGAPRGNEPPALQGPIAQPERTPFEPPTGVKKAAGIEGAVPGEYRGQGPAGYVNIVNSLGTPKANRPSIRVIEGVDVKVAPSTDGKSVRIESIRSAEPQKGAGTRVMQRLVAEADQTGTPLEVTAQPTSVKKGGRIPLPKLVEWYKTHGFEVVEEGNGFATMKRTPESKTPVSEPVIAAFKEEGPAVAERMKGVEATKAIEAAGNVVPGEPIMKGSLGKRIETQLDLFAKNAETRLNKKIGRLQAGFDPTDLTDLAIIGAAKMFKLGLRSKKLFTEAMTKLYGDVIAPHINDIYEKALKVLERSISGGPTKRQMTHLMELAQSGRHGMDWYEETATWAKQVFKDDADMMLRFLAATSADSQTAAGATMALKAFHQWKMGMPFDGMRSKSMVMNLERAARGEQFGGDKIDSFYRALRGDKDAVVLDRWMMRALGFKNAGSAGGSGNFGGTQYRMFSEVVRGLAEEAEMSPRQFQAAIWEGARVSSLHGKFKSGGAVAASKVGSARPLEHLVQTRLDGRTPVQWIEENGLQLDQLRHISAGLKASREQGGYTFNPFTYETDKTPGFIVTLASDVMHKKLFYATAITKWRQAFSQHIDVSAFGDIMRGGQHLNIGTYNMGEFKPDHFSVDLNIVLPENMREQALALGLKNKQIEIGHIDAAGNYTGHKTGYVPTKKNPQDIPPLKGPERAAWFKRKNTEVGSMLDQIGSYTIQPPSPTALPEGALRFMVQNPGTALAHAGEVLRKTPEEMKKLVDSGDFHPMTDAGVEGAAFVTKDGSIWQYVDPKGPSYNTTKLVGTLRGKNLVAMLDKLKGMEVVSGHDIIESYRSQAGFARFTRPAAMPASKVPELVTAMTKTGGKVVPLSVLDEKSFGTGMNSFWLLPNGRLIRSDMQHSRHADLIAKKMSLPSVKGYEGGIHGAGSRVHALLNMGVIRVQASGSMIAFDLSAKITSVQRSIMKSAMESHPDWAAQVADEKGVLVSNFASFNNKAHHFLASAGGEE